MNFGSISPARSAALGVLLALMIPRTSRAESAVRYKYQDYHEEGGRIAVKVHSAGVEQDFGTATHLKVEGIVDAIAGATPNGQPAPEGSDQVPLSKLSERRKAWNAALSHQFRDINVSLGVANSRESDYVSTGASLNSLFDFNEKNTTLLLGVAATDDDIKVFYQTARAKKRTQDLILGITQVVDPRTSATINVSFGRQRGYLSDPYKLVQKSTEIISGVFLPLTYPENRPDERTKLVALFGLNRAFPELRGAVDVSYRLYTDSYDTVAHTIDVAWFQDVSEHLIVRPGLRFYDQNAAEFYRYRLDGTDITPTAGAPRPLGPFYSSDYRLSAMQTFTYGLKLIWTISEAWQMDATVERYEMRGTDRVTPQSAYAQANIVTFGGKFSW